MSADEIGENATLLDAMAQEAATAYYDNATRYGTGKYPARGVRSGRNWSKFVRIARICMVNKVKPSLFVDMAFVQTMQRHSIVTAQDIASFDVRELSKAKQETSGAMVPQDTWNLLSCKLLDMLFSIDGVRDKNELLNSTMYGFPAWFRVFSPQNPIQDIVVHWGDLAYEELKDNPDLDAYLRNKRPRTYSFLATVIEKFKQVANERKI